MMSSRRQSKQVDDGEFCLECKAAFLTMCDDVDDRIESKRTLRTLLQTSGRNPSERKLNTYWPPKNKDYMTFNDFVETCRKEPITSVDDLMKAFRRIDINGDGYISLDELYKIMNKKDEPMTREEVRKMIDDVDDNKDGKLDYSEFSNMIIKTSEESKKFSVKVMERKERKKRRTERGIENARSHQTASEASHSARKSEESHKADKEIRFKKDLPPDSARTVGEEIEYDDDCDIVSTGRPTPRFDLNSSRKDTARQTPRTDTQSKPPKKPDKDGSVQGSHASLRSGDLGAPVPSPRKTLSSRLPEDDMPRPSPRLTLKKDSKGKSSSTRSRDKLPDARSLRDWSKFTSKGCFFYEDDEIVTHVFSLKLRDDSTVFLSAFPIQEPPCLNLPSVEPIDTALFIFDSQGRLVTCTEQKDVQGKYGVKVELTAGQYQVLPYTTGCRFKQRPADSRVTEATLIDKDDDDNVVIKHEFRRALEQIFDLCDLDDNGTMSYDEFNWFNLRTSGEELEEEEWKVVEERTTLKGGEITKKGFILLNEMEAEDIKGDTDDLWITLTSMGINKALEMDEACPYRVEVYVEEPGGKQPLFKVTGIESLEKKEFTDEICRYILEKGEPEKVRNMKDLYTCTYKSENRATIVVDNRSRSTVNLEVDCSKSRNVKSNHDTLDYTFEVDPQSAAIAHHLLPRSELKDWSINVTETIHK